MQILGTFEKDFTDRHILNLTFILFYFQYYLLKITKEIDNLKIATRD